jgi:hypothetical protein
MNGHAKFFANTQYIFYKSIGFYREIQTNRVEMDNVSLLRSQPSPFGNVKSAVLGVLNNPYFKVTC